MVIDGKQIADGIIVRLKTKPAPKKFLAVVLVGDDKSSLSFIAQKEKVSHELGVDFRLYQLPTSGDAGKNDGLREEIRKIAAHKTCGGVIVQLPLPAGVNRHYVLNAIPPEKDVDVLGERALGSFYAERGRVVPPAVATVDEIVRAQKLSLEKSSVAVVGLGLLVGRPIATWAMWRAKETFLLRSTSDITIARQADIVISGVGKAGLLTAKNIKPGATVIDFGYEHGCGDFDPAIDGGGDVRDIAYTPTPGGTGPILVAKLFENFYKLNNEEERA